MYGGVEKKKKDYLLVAKNQLRYRLKLVKLQSTSDVLYSVERDDTNGTKRIWNREAKILWMDVNRRKIDPRSL